MQQLAEIGHALPQAQQTLFGDGAVTHRGFEAPLDKHTEALAVADVALAQFGDAFEYQLRIGLGGAEALSVDRRVAHQGGREQGDIAEQLFGIAGAGVGIAVG